MMLTNELNGGEEITFQLYHGQPDSGNSNREPARRQKHHVPHVKIFLFCIQWSFFTAVPLRAYPACNGQSPTTDTNLALSNL